jgi:hypothetical protein
MQIWHAKCKAVDRQSRDTIIRFPLELGFFLVFGFMVASKEIPNTESVSCQGV